MITYKSRTKTLKSRSPAARAAHLEALVIRPARAEDLPAVARLAALDSAEAPAGPVLLAEVAGEAWAAITLEGGAVVADPFRPTIEIAGLLRLRASQLNGDDNTPPTGPRGLAALRTIQRAA